MKKYALGDDYRKIFEHSEGTVFFGGPDLPPEVYNEKTSLHTSIYDPYRHYFELSFLFHLLGGYQAEKFEPLLKEDPDYLIYGFCLGMQTMNVATGGTMMQRMIFGSALTIHYFLQDLRCSGKPTAWNFTGISGKTFKRS